MKELKLTWDSEGAEMSILGRAITRLARQCGGQVLLELPDDLPPHIVGRLVASANEEAGAPGFALFANDRRADVDSIVPSVSFRELAAYRQGNHVAVAYASENRGMHTYTSVYPNLLAPGFPDELEETVLNGVGSLRALSVNAAGIISERHRLSPKQASELKKTIPHVARFLADAFLAAGNGQTSLAADWWFRADEWLTSLDEWISGNGAEQVERAAFGSAGIPFRSGMEDGVTPIELVKALTERWSSPESVRMELARLSGDSAAMESAEALESLPWESEMPRVSIRTDSIMSRVGLDGVLDATARARRTKGWACLDAAVFKNVFVEAKNKLVLRISGIDVPRPWSGGPATISLPASSSATGDWLDLGSVELLVPWKVSSVPHADELPPGLEKKFDVRGARKSDVEFTATSVHSSPAGLKLAGRLRLKPSSKVPHAATIVVVANPPASTFVVDESSVELTLVRHDEVVLYLRRSEGAGSGRKSALGPYLWREGAQAETVVPLVSPGKYFMAVAAGVSTSAVRSPMKCGESDVSGAWPCSVLEGKYLFGEFQLDDGAEISALHGMFAVEVSEQGVDPHLSPVVSAAFSQQPDIEKQITEGALSWLDSIVTEQVAELFSGKAIGITLLASGAASGNLIQDDFGSYVDRDLMGRLGSLTPGVPTSVLVENACYTALSNAYRNLGIPERIETLQQGHDVASLTISRLSLEFISQEQIDSLLNAYLELIKESASFSPADRFWAKHPFGVAIFPSAIGSQSADAVLLSPLHPLRLAWLWMVQKGLRAAADDGLSPETALGLLDPTAYPAHLSMADPLGAAGHYIPLPLEASPDALYLGWQALVKFSNGEAKFPEAISGRALPIEGLSSISSGAVSSALDDFLRVSPHVQALRIGLESTMAARRSQALDGGILDKVAILARRSAGSESVGGVSILDSTNRLGSIPSFRILGASLKAARPGFNVSWTSRSPGATDRVHLSFLEGTAARLALVEGHGAREGWIPAIPLRRFPKRRRPAPGTTDLDYSLPVPCAEHSHFQNSLSAYEAGEDGVSTVVRVIPNLAALPSRPSWLVAGDFGADPQAIAEAASLGNGQDYMLWDWRPISTVQLKASPTTGKVQPYFVLATVPKALSAAIAGRIAKLRSGLTPDETAQRTRKLVSVLAMRAIGLNTLLAVGHHQATGALGFYFAIESLTKWASEAIEGETRIILPVDAVDPYLRTLPGANGESRRRADLIAVSIRRDSADDTRVKLVPIEIKHYGLNSQGPTLFPASGDAGLIEHLSQLSSYQKQLLSLASNYTEGASSATSIFGSRLAIVLEAGMQLCSPEKGGQDSSVLSDIASGKASIDIGKGALLWFQAGASTVDGKKAVWIDIPGTDENRHVEVRVDPAAFDEFYWGGQVGGPHGVVSEALACAMGGHISENVESVGVGDTATSVIESPEVKEFQISKTSSVVGGSSEKSNSDQDSHAGLKPSTRGALNPSELERRYAQILDSLEEFNVKARRPKMDDLPYSEGPSFVEYAIEPAYGVSVSKIESQLDNLKLRLKLPSDAQIGCTTHLGNVLLSVPKLDSDRYFIDAEEMWSRWGRPEEGFRIPLGEDMKGNVIDIDLSSSNSPHVLLAGVTGSGKSEALLTLLHGAVRYYDQEELKLALIDPKRTELVSMDGVPHKLGEIGFTAEEAIVLLAAAVDEMERRYEAFRSSKVRDIQEFQTKVGKMPRWLMVLDEYADLTSDDDDRKEIEKHLKRLAQKARAAGIHLIVSTQKPVVSVINTIVKGNLPGRIALRVSTAVESKVILDETGAEQLTGKGDGLMKTGARKVRLQFARVSS